MQSHTVFTTIGCIQMSLTLSPDHRLPSILLKRSVLFPSLAHYPMTSIPKENVNYCARSSSFIQFPNPLYQSPPPLFTFEKSKRNASQDDSVILISSDSSIIEISSRLYVTVRFAVKLRKMFIY